MPVAPDRASGDGVAALRAERDGRSHRRPHCGRRHPREPARAPGHRPRPAPRRADVRDDGRLRPRRSPRRPDVRAAARRRRLRAPALAERRPYRTNDGYICALVYNDKQWERFLRAIGRESLLQEDARFATFAARSRHIDFVYGELARIFEERSTAEWMALLEEADVPVMPMHDLKSRARRSAPRATGFFRPSSIRAKARSARCGCR